MATILRFNQFTPAAQGTLQENFLDAPESDEYGKRIMYRAGDYLISVDSPVDAAYLVLWYKGKNVGMLSLSSHHFEGAPYRRVRATEIKPAHRGMGFGFKLYQLAMRTMSPAYAGIVSYLPERTNKKQVPRIYQKLGGHLAGADYAIIPNPGYVQTT